MSLHESELILSRDKRVYHLNLIGDEIADDVILVGDPDRVGVIAAYFSKTESGTSHREFISQTGWYNNRRITVLSTGIGPDNIDIVMNELDAAVNFDLNTRTEKKKKRSLNIYRLGTCGGLQPELTIDSLVSSSFALGFDNLLYYYQGLDTVNEQKIVDAFCHHAEWSSRLQKPYCVASDELLLQRFTSSTFCGITATAPGFYGPQGRMLRLPLAKPDLNHCLNSFLHNNLQVMNFEMECSALYGLGRLLGHRCLTICVVIANRLRKEFSTDYHKSVKHLVETTLNLITHE